MSDFNPVPKPTKKRRGRSVRRDPKIAEVARKRDGTCLAGLFLKDGCVPGFEPHHITKFGRDPRLDVLENLICLCRRHHQMAENHLIAPITLQGILYHFYGYGPSEHIVGILDGIKEIASDHGMRVRFWLNPEVFHAQFIGTFGQLRYSWAWLEWDRIRDPGVLHTDIDNKLRGSLLASS